MILDGRGCTLAVIHPTALRLVRFCDVTAEMALVVEEFVLVETL
ncbi:hypothetical protein [Sodalis glossinidius]|nr:hypothetical protein [Sodalis glossinidius]